MWTRKYADSRGCDNVLPDAGDPRTIERGASDGPIQKHLPIYAAYRERPVFRRWSEPFLRTFFAENEKFLL